MGDVDISLVMPCYNEAASLERTVVELTGAFEQAGHRLQLVAVDNGSTDGTAAAIESLAGKHESVELHRVARNEGYGHGILSGLPHCRGTWVGLVHADGQVDAADVVRLYEEAVSSRAPVLAKVRRRFRMDGRRRKIVSVSYNLFIRLLWPRLGSIDVNGTPKILPRDAVRAMHLQSHGWMLDPELMVKAQYLGLRVLEFNVLARVRSAGLSHVRVGTCWEFLTSLVILRLTGRWKRDLRRSSLIPHGPTGPDTMPAVAVRSLSTLGARVSRLIRRPDPGRVRRVTLAVSWLCDCRCQMCGIWKIYANDPGGHRSEMPAGDMVRLLGEAECLRSLEAITFTGGEPFIHKEFAALAVALGARFPRAQLDVTTTGQATAGILDKLEAIQAAGGDLGRMHICVSLDGVGAQHDAVRGRAGAFERAMQTVAAIRALPIGSLGLGFTILPSNHTSLRDAYRMAVREGVGFTMRVAHFNAGLYGNQAEAAAHRWTPSAVAAVEAAVKAIVDDKRRRRGLAQLLFGSDLFFADRMLDYLRQPRRLMPCYSGTHSTVVDPHGNVAPCVNLERRMGSARDRGFDAVWRSREADEIRRFIGEARCHCWTECESYLSFHTSPRYLLYNLRALAHRGAPETEPCPEPV